MGRNVIKICLSCERVVKKRNNRACPECGGKIVSLTQEIVDKLCKLREQRENKANKKKKAKEGQKMPWSGGEIW